jgi:hypothetical protein
LGINIEDIQQKETKNVSANEHFIDGIISANVVEISVCYNLFDLGSQES